MKAHYVRGGLGDSIVKKRLEGVLQEMLAPIRARREEFAKDKGLRDADAEGRHDEGARSGGRHAVGRRGLACGWPGGLLAQQWLRHKSIKTAFRWKFWLTVALNLALLAALLWCLQAAGVSVGHVVLRPQG
jgi:hypothetical protein